MNILKTKYLLVISLCLGALLLINKSEITSKSNTAKKIYPTLPNSEKQGFLIRTPGCKIPIPINSKKKKDEAILICENPIPPLIESNLSHIYVNQEALVYYNHYRNDDGLSCCYNTIWRREPIVVSEVSASYSMSNYCVYFNDSARILQEFIKVTCKISQSVYEDFFIFIHVPRKKISPRKDLNVIIINLNNLQETISNVQLTKTYQFLKSIGSHEFYGFSKFSNEQILNLTPMLTGLNLEELENICNFTKSYFDDCPFIWKDFKSQNYLTAYIEDNTENGVFLRNHLGFKKQPSDYYWLFFDLIAKRYIGNGNLCFGSRFTHKIYFQNFWNFILKISEAKINYFALFLTHQLRLGKAMDKELYQLLEKMFVYGIFEKSILILIIDYKPSDNSPSLYVRIPKLLKKQYPEAALNLDINSNRLVTYFDIYESLKDILNNFKGKKFKSKKHERGISLFQEIPGDRNCTSASIGRNWCKCLPSFSLNQNSKIVRKVTSVAISYLNDNSDRYCNCTKLYLSKILNATLMKYPEKDFETDETFEDYIVQFRTLPNLILYEATVRKLFKKLMNYVIKYKVLDVCPLS